jgi:hypothetical protein
MIGEVWSRAGGWKCTGADGVSMLIIHTIQCGERMKIRACTCRFLGSSKYVKIGAVLRQRSLIDYLLTVKQLTSIPVNMET